MKQDLIFLHNKARNEMARQAIRQALLSPDQIKANFGLSQTAYEQLAGHVRAGFVA